MHIMEKPVSHPAAAQLRKMDIVVSIASERGWRQGNMRRFLVQTLGMLVLVGGPTYPYIHLAEVPHRYCPIHGTFEKIPYHYDESGRQVPDRPLGGDKDDEHEKCFIAALTLSAVHTGPTDHLGIAAHSVIADAPLLQVAVLPWFDVLRLAPKASPPAAG